MKVSTKEIQEICLHLVKKIWNFLHSTQCREFLFFLFFVIIAATFWILQTLNENYDTEVSIPLRMKNIPENVVFTDDIPQNFTLTVEDKGTVLVNYMLGQSFTPITLDFNEYQNPNNHIRLLTSDLEKKIQNQLMASTKLLDITPDTLEIFYTQGEGKKVPVQFNGHATAKHQYYIASRTITPDSVMVYAPKNFLSTLDKVLTETVDYTDIADTVNYTIGLAPMKGVKFIPEKVDIQYHADILTEKTIAVPIIGMNFPADKQLKTFPSKINITFQVGMRQFKNITANDFTVGISYNDIQSNTSSDRCEPKLITSPENIDHIRFSPTSVEYLIEQKF